MATFTRTSPASRAPDEDRVTQKASGPAHVEPIERRRAVEDVAVDRPEGRRSGPRPHDGPVSHERHPDIARRRAGRLLGEEDAPHFSEGLAGRESVEARLADGPRGSAPVARGELTEQAVPGPA